MSEESTAVVVEDDEMEEFYNAVLQVDAITPLLHQPDQPDQQQQQNEQPNQNPEYTEALNQVTNLIQSNPQLLLQSYPLYKTPWSNSNACKSIPIIRNIIWIDPMQWTAYLGNVDLCKLFISHLPPDHIKRGNFLHSLCIASAEGHTSIVQLIFSTLKQVGDTCILNSAPYCNGNTPLLVAIKYGHVDTVKVLLNENPKSVWIKDEHGLLPIHYACYSRNSDIISLLLEQGDFPLFQNDTCDELRDSERSEYGQDNDNHDNGDNDKDCSWKAPWQQNQHTLWHTILQNYTKPSSSSSLPYLSKHESISDQLPKHITTQAQYLTTILSKSHSFPILTNAIGKLNLEHVSMLMKYAPINYTLPNEHGRTLLVEIIRQSYYHQEHWDDYYCSLFFNVFCKSFAKEEYTHLEMIDSVSQRHLLHIAVDYELPWEGIQKILDKSSNGGSTNDGSTNDGSTNDGSTNDGSTNDGSTNDGSTNGGPSALSYTDTNGLYPFMTAAEGSKFTCQRGLLPFISQKRSLRCLTTTFELLRAKPDVLDSVLHRRTFLRNKLKYRGYGQVDDIQTETYGLPPIIIDYIDELRESMSTSTTCEKGGSTHTTTTASTTCSGRGTTPEIAPNKHPNHSTIVSTLEQHYTNGQFRPTYTYGSALTLLIEIGETPLTTNPMIKNDNANCYPINFGANYNVERKSNSHVPMDILRRHHRQEIRILRYHELTDYILQHQVLNIAKYYFCETNHMLLNWTEVDLDMPDPTVLKEDSLDPSEIGNLVVYFLLQYNPYCNGGTTPKVLEDGRQVMSWNDMENQCKILHSLYKETKKPLGDPNVYVPTCLRGGGVDDGGGVGGGGGGKKNKSSKNSKGKKGKKKVSSKKKKKYTHGQVVSHLISKLFETLLNTIQRPSLQYAQFIHVLTNMFFDAALVDSELAIAICAEEHAGLIVLNLRQKALKYARDMDEVTLLPQIFSQVWWGSFGRCSFILTHAMRKLFSDKLDLKLSVKALDFFRKRLCPELIKNVLSDSDCERYVGWRSINMVISLVPMNIITDFLSNEELWGSIGPLCLTDFEACLDQKALDSEKDKKRVRKRHSQAAQEALHFVSLVCKKVRQDGNAGTTRYGQMVQRLIYLDVIGLCIECAKKKESGYLFVYTAMESLVALASIHKKCRDRLWEDKDVVFEVCKSMMTSNNCNHVHIAMDLVQELLVIDECREMVIKMEPPIETLCMQLATFGMKHFHDRAYIAQSDYLIMKEQLINGADKYNETQKQLTKTFGETKWLVKYNELRKKLLVSTHWCEMEKSYTEGDIENAMASSVLLLSNLTKDRRYLYRFSNISCLSVAAACLESSNRKLFASAVTLLSNFFSATNITNFPVPSDFQDPEYLVEMLKYHFTNPKQVILQEIPFMVDLIGNMLYGINIAPDWPEIFHPSMMERQTRRSSNDAKESILRGGW